MNIVALRPLCPPPEGFPVRLSEAQPLSNVPLPVLRIIKQGDCKGEPCPGSPQSNPSRQDPPGSESESRGLRALAQARSICLKQRYPQRPCVGVRCQPVGSSWQALQRQPLAAQAHAPGKLPYQAPV